MTCSQRVCGVVVDRGMGKLKVRQAGGKAGGRAGGRAGGQAARGVKSCNSATHLSTICIPHFQSLRASELHDGQVIGRQAEVV